MSNHWLPSKMMKNVFIAIDDFLQNDALGGGVIEFVKALNQFHGQDGQVIEYRFVDSLLQAKSMVKQMAHLSLNESVFIGSKIKDVKEAQTAGMTSFLYSQNKDSQLPSIDRWSEALIRIALSEAPQKTKNLELATSILADDENLHDIVIEFVDKTTVKGRGKLWTSIEDETLDELSGINIERSCNFEIEVPIAGDVQFSLEKIDESRKETVDYLQSLKTHGGIENINPSPIQQATHVVETDAKSGMRKLKRKGFR